MIQCPWCTKEVEIIDNICPECKHEVLIDEQGDILFEDSPETEEEVPYSEVNLEEVIKERFKCVKCGHRKCDVDEVAMTGTGLSKIFDVQYNHFLFVSCHHCGYVEVYNPSILANKNSGTLSTVLDILFGR
ncbi:zinc ribbon domain-containing protein [Paenibacillus puldeungensis]|uniref:Zinc ribbon domain-containing protein n=1 Tax=Paenibacillus puldeungensis TaxID=696536 RepID=A0ABW3S0G3_9BACL